MVMLYAISRSAYKLSAFCALKDTPAMLCERSPAADATVG